MAVYAIVTGRVGADSISGLTAGTYVATVTLPEGVAPTDLSLELSEVFTSAPDSEGVFTDNAVLSSDAEGVYLTVTVAAVSGGINDHLLFRLVFVADITPTIATATWSME